jgi:enoyl-CoA hydratase/carnithine racemase
VSCPNGSGAALERLAEVIARSPGASTSLVQLLRIGSTMSAADAVVAESMTYSLLQGGPDHRRWLDARRDRERRARPESPVVEVSRRGSTLRLMLDRPEVRNAYGARMRDELVDAVRLARIDTTIDFVELRGAGPVFCSGGDLDEFGTASDPVTAHMIRTTRNVGIDLTRIADSVTAYVHGQCVGAGVELPAFARRVVAHSNTTFLLPEIAMGLVPGAGGTSSIPRRIGHQRATWLALIGEPIDARTALAWGLIDLIDDDAFTGSVST